VLVRADSGGGTHEFLGWRTRPGRRRHYSVGLTITDDIAGAIVKIPAAVWTPAYDGEGQVRDGAWVAEITGVLNLDGWPAGMRVIVRKERPHPRRTAAVHRHQRAPVHLLRHRRQATGSAPISSCGTGGAPGARTGTIRCAKDTGLRNLPLHGFA
jgi:Transposase DDE domain group 1